MFCMTILDSTNQSDSPTSHVIPKRLVARALVDPIDLRVARDEAPQWFADEGEDRALLHRFLGRKWRHDKASVPWFIVDL